MDAKLRFNTSYSFKLRLEWTNRVNNTDIFDVTEIEAQTLWLNFTVPFFEIEKPDQILLTADSNRFSIILANYLIPDLSIYEVTWSIVPNISLQKLPLTMNNTMLTLPKDSLLPRKSYTISVTILNKLYPSLKRSQSYSFVTKMPPYGGSVKVDPMIGYLGETEFTV